MASPSVWGVAMAGRSAIAAWSARRAAAYGPAWRWCPRRASRAGRRRVRRDRSQRPPGSPERGARDRPVAARRWSAGRYARCGRRGPCRPAVRGRRCRRVRPPRGAGRRPGPQPGCAPRTRLGRRPGGVLRPAFSLPADGSAAIPAPPLAVGAAQLRFTALRVLNLPAGRAGLHPSVFGNPRPPFSMPPCCVPTIVVTYIFDPRCPCLGLFGVAHPVEDRVAVPAVECGEELGRGRVGVQRCLRVLRDRGGLL